MTANELTKHRRISQRKTAAIRNPRRWYYTALRCFTANGRRHNRRVAADTKQRNKPVAVPGRVRHGGRFFTPDGTTIVVRGGKGVYLDDAEALYDKMIYNDAGFDGQGYNRDGFDWGGVHRNGTQYDDNGYSWDGFDKDGFDKDGFDKDGFDKDGFDKDGFDDYGRDRNGHLSATTAGQAQQAPPQKPHGDPAEDTQNEMTQTGINHDHL